MHSYFKRFLLSLLLLILPLQGFASAAMLGCAFSHPAQAMQHAIGEQTMMDDSAATCHEPKPTGKTPASHECTHCAGCYLTSAGLVPTLDIAPIASAAHSIAPRADAAFTGFIPDSPERPPRPLFA